MRFALLVIAAMVSSSIVLADDRDAASDTEPQTPEEVVAAFNTMEFDGRKISAIPPPKFQLPDADTAIEHTTLKIGQQLPEISGTTLGDEPYILKFTDDTHATLLVFWSSSCAPCLHEAPFERALHQIYKDRGFRLVSVNCDPRLALAKRTAKQHNIDWPTLYDGTDGPIAEAFGIGAFPTLLLMDVHGKIIASTDELRSQGFTAASPDDIVLYERGLCSALRQLFPDADHEPTEIGRTTP